VCPVGQFHLDLHAVPFLVMINRRDVRDRVLIGRNATPLRAIMSGNGVKGAQEGLKDSKCERGNVINWPPMLIDRNANYSIMMS
jgi:hypothetical protein